MKSLHYLDLLNDTPLSLLISELVLVIDLDSDVIPGVLVRGLLDNGVGALTEDLTKTILTDRGVV